MGVIVKEHRPGEWWIFINHNGRRKAKKVGHSQKNAEDLPRRSRPGLCSVILI